MHENWLGAGPLAIASRYDFVVVGGGTAGCVLANRLSEDRDVSVLLLEAGGPNGSGARFNSVSELHEAVDLRRDWGYETLPQAQLGGRSLHLPRGKGLGGSSGLGAMAYLRGHSADFDAWAKELGAGWSWRDLLPLFRELEAHQSGDSEFHGGTGDWPVERPRTQWAILEAVARAAQQAGVPRVDDFNTGENEGCGYFDVHRRRGARVDAAAALLRPVAYRANLTIVLNSIVNSVCIERGRVTAVDVEAPGYRMSVGVKREVILAAGAIGSPCILQRSGIGPGSHLRSLGIPVVRDLPVGENFQDQLQIRMTYRVRGARTLNAVLRSRNKRLLSKAQCLVFGRGPLVPVELGILARSSMREQQANLQMRVMPLSLGMIDGEPHDFPGISISAFNLRPKSRGRVLVRGQSTVVSPSIDPQYLQDRADRRVAAESVRLARLVMSQPAMSDFVPTEETPGSRIQSEEELLESTEAICASAGNPVGTCKLGMAQDAVVDPTFKVLGISGLRVADASVLPTIPSGNSIAATAAIALKAAGTVAAELGLRRGNDEMRPYDLFRNAIPLW